jgi:hypothetical protein
MLNCSRWRILAGCAHGGICHGARGEDGGFGGDGIDESGRGGGREGRPRRRRRPGAVGHGHGAGGAAHGRGREGRPGAAGEGPPGKLTDPPATRGYARAAVERDPDGGVWLVVTTAIPLSAREAGDLATSLMAGGAPENPRGGGLAGAIDAR